jgi:hypothetical protein
VHGNEQHALRALGSSLASGWHGRGALHSRARAELARGIDPGGHRGAGGEVTTLGMVGAMLSMLGAHGGCSGILSERGVAGLHRCRVGLSKGASRDGASPLGVCSGGGGRRQGRGKRVLARWPQDPPLPLESNQIRQGVNLCQDFLLELLKNCW